MYNSKESYVLCVIALSETLQGSSYVD